MKRRLRMAVVTAAAGALLLPSAPPAAARAAVAAPPTAAYIDWCDIFTPVSCAVVEFVADPPNPADLVESFVADMFLEPIARGVAEAVAVVLTNAVGWWLAMPTVTIDEQNTSTVRL
ncbi:MAG: hypothetical protein L0Y54_12020 [Sporichthyaceae bacterium]|nr:hypothetical protein [Sporichthyaceae bacterium]